MVWSYNDNQTVMDAAGNVLSGRVFTIWTAETGGAQVTTVTTWAGGAVSGGQITSESDGRLRFKETTQAYPILWRKAPDNSMYPVYALEAVGAGGTAFSTAAVHTWSAVQTFTADPVFNDASIPMSKVIGLVAAIAAASKPVFRGSVANQVARLALSAAVTGDWCIQQDTDARYDLTGTTFSNDAHWTKNPTPSYTNLPAVMVPAAKGSARPTARTDVLVVWTGAGIVAPTGWLPSDLTIQQG